MADELTDLEITRMCAEAMGFTPYRANWGVIQVCSESGIYIVSDRKERRYIEYDPLHDDAQCMALEDWLIERGYLSFRRYEMRFNPFTREVTQEQVIAFSNKQERRRAVCLCVAHMQQEKDRRDDK